MSIAEKIDSYFEREFPNANSSVFRDLMLNLKKILEESPLSESDRFLSLTAVSQSLHMSSLVTLATAQLQTLDLSAEQIKEAKENAAIMGMLNTYYKFKSYLPSDVSDKYPRTGLRMQALAKPQNGKASFEMMSFAVSVVNGCPSCVASHEKALRELNVEPDKIHDLARLASVVKGLSCLN